MRKFPLIALFVLLFGFGSGRADVANGDGVAPPKVPSTSAANSDEPVGTTVISRLGKPLGTVMKLQGVVAPGPFKGYEGGPNLFVRRIDGVATQKHIRIPLTFSSESQYKGKEIDREVASKVTWGAQIEIFGYETGWFGGRPSELQPRKLAPQTTGHGFFNRLMLHSAEDVAPIEFDPAEYVGRQAYVEGTAENVDGSAVLRKGNWRVFVQGRMWTPSEVGKEAHAFGKLASKANTDFLLSDVLDSRRGLVKLDDMLEKQPRVRVTLRGTGFCFNSFETLDYRGEELCVKLDAGLEKTVWRHGGAVTVSGELFRAGPSNPESNLKPCKWMLLAKGVQDGPDLLWPEMSPPGGE